MQLHRSLDNAGLTQVYYDAFIPQNTGLLSK